MPDYKIPTTPDVILVSTSDLTWSFNSERPSFYLGRGEWKRSYQVDPFPCYHHVLELVKESLNLCLTMFPIGFPPAVYVLPNETTSRVNAETASDYIYDREHPDATPPFTPNIVLYGKRIPIMPSMTRYLVTHEYGHVVEDWLAYNAGIKESDDKFINDYAALRKYTGPRHGGGGTWHKSMTEIFANDFRILITKAEIEFWPHPDVQRPETNSELVAWWDEQQRTALRLV